MGFTNAQLKAIKAERDNILVCAAAGSGKTTVLCNRIAQRIANKECDISKTLVVTFTIASADDLKRKLRETLNEECAKATDRDTKRYIQKQLSLLPKARISTIHSFALEIIRRNFDKLGLPAKIRVGDSWESGLIANRTMDAVIEEKYKNYDGSFTRLTDLLIADRDGSLGEYFLKLYYNLSNESRGIETILDNIRLINKAIEEDDNPWERVIRDNAAMKLDYCVKHLKSAADCYSEESPSYEFYGTRFRKVYETAVHLRNCLDEGFDKLAEAISDVEFVQFKGKGLNNEAKSDLSENHGFHMSVFNFLKDLCDKRGKKLGMDFSISTSKEDMEKTAEHLACLYSILSEFEKKFSEEKIRRAMVDFTDIERLAHRLLLDEKGNKTELAIKYADEFEELYIDEYQDTNRVQDDIFRALSKKNMFIVGDIKQSIYGFRGACPEIFSSYRSEGFGEDGGLTVFLSENFRSDPNVINFSNGIFSQIMSGVSTVGYTSEDNLVFSKKKNIKDEKTELYLFCEKNDKNNKNKKSKKTEKNNEVNEEADKEKNTSMAEFTASYIRNELDKGVSPEDVAVLCRSLTGKGVSELIECCRKYGVPISLGDGAEYFKKPWILLLLAIINTIDNKTRDIYVTGALYGELFGFTLDMLTRVRTDCPSSLGMWYSLEEYIKKREETGDIDDICICGKRFVSFINRMREVEANSSVDELVRTVIYQSRIIEALSIGQSEERRDEIRSDIIRLYSYAVDFASRSSMGLSSFVAYLKEIMESGQDKSKKGSSSGAVRLITIHGSKGLQYPICILYNAEKNFKLSADKDCPLMYSGALGIALKLSGDAIEDKHDTILTSALKIGYAAQQREEEMRLLYVAFTRAENRLVVVGKSSIDMNDPPPSKDIYARVMSANNYLDWIYLCIDAINKNDEWKDSYLYKQNPQLQTGDLAASEKLLRLDGEMKLTEEEKRRLDNVLHGSGNSSFVIPAKATVSELSPDYLDSSTEDKIQRVKAANHSERDTKLPDFMSGEAKISGAKRGTATHLFMQFCDFSRCEKYGVENEIERLVDNRYIDRETAGLISVKKVESFFMSSLYKRIKESRNLMREQRFNIKLDASLFTKDAEKKKALSGQEIFVQGVVDCVFVDLNGDMVLVDYKTDGFAPDTPRDEVISILKERYTNQLYYYLLALDRIFPEAKKKACIYSFFLDSDFNLDIDSTEIN